MQECTFCSLFFKKISLYYYFGLVVQCHNNILVRKGMTQNSEVSSLIVLFPQLYFCYFQIAHFTLAWTRAKVEGSRAKSSCHARHNWEHFHFCSNCLRQTLKLLCGFKCSLSCEKYISKLVIILATL